MKITLTSPIAISDLVLMAGGRLENYGIHERVGITGICTDSREADANTLFCAIRGERVDGHDYMAKAAQMGCTAFLCERVPETLSALACACIVVEDTVEALSALAGARRETDMKDLSVVAVTGSVGKTTTKEMTAAVLGQGRALFKKDGNFNSTIGLPLSFMEIPSDTACAVLEMGMSGRGEIRAMTDGVRPDIAMVVNVGSSHMELLGSRENIARAKLEIAAGLRHGGVLLLNGDEPLLRNIPALADELCPTVREDVRVLYLSLQGADYGDYFAANVTPCEGGSYFDLTTPTGVWNRLFVPAVGQHMVWAASFAAAAGQLCGLSEGQVRAGLLAFRPANMRQNVRVVADVTLIEDCYNAAPESMKAALGVLNLTHTAASVPNSRRVAVLGDMKELGSRTVELHRLVGSLVAEGGADLLVTVGELGAHIAQGALEQGMSPDSVWITGEAETYPSTAERLAACLRPGDTVLFKASRAMTLETLSAALAAALDSTQG